MLGCTAHAAELGVLDDVGQRGHPDKRGDQNEDLGVGQLNETGTDINAPGTREQSRNALLLRALGDLCVVLQDQGDTDRTDQRGESSGVTQGFVGDTLDDPAIHRRDDDGEDQRAEHQQWERFDTEVRQQSQTDCRQVSRNHVNLAVGEVDHADDAVDHCVADGDQAIDRPEGQAIDQLLQENTIHNAISRNENLHMWLCGSSKENTDIRRSNVSHDQAGHHGPL
ncbi:hypothetical protein D3C85_1191790 [compost metagenome]